MSSQTSLQEGDRRPESEKGRREAEVRAECTRALKLERPGSAPPQHGRPEGTRPRTSDPRNSAMAPSCCIKVPGGDGLLRRDRRAHTDSSRKGSRSHLARCRTRLCEDVTLPHKCPPNSAPALPPQDPHSRGLRPHPQLPQITSDRPRVTAVSVWGPFSGQRRLPDFPPTRGWLAQPGRGRSVSPPHAPTDSK